jgi:hypothetical protein
MPLTKQEIPAPSIGGWTGGISTWTLVGGEGGTEGDGSGVTPKNRERNLNRFEIMIGWYIVE